MVCCGCAIEAQYIKQQIEVKKQKNLSVNWQKFLERQVEKNGRHGAGKAKQEGAHYEY